MKMKKMTAVCVLVAMLAGISACGSPEPANAENPGTEAEKETTVTTEPEQNEGKEMKGESGTQTAAAPTQGEATQSPVTFAVYYSNDDATALVQETAEVEALTPENVLIALIERGIIATDIRVLGFQEVEVDGKRALNIDFSQEFGTFLGSMGSTGEYLILGSVCNTFLSAYGCEKVQITVEGGVLSTGHNEYPGYFGYFE